MNFSTESYGPANECIYCRSKKGLSKEHIFPAGFDGNIVILKASCSVCQKEINDNIENPLMHGMFKDVRYKLAMGLQRAKKKPKRPKSRFVSVGPYGRLGKLLVPYKDYPNFVVMPRLPPPGILREKSAEQSSKEFSHSWRAFGSFASRHIGQRFEQKYNLPIFVRQLAKIAHGHAVLKFGLDGFESYLTDIILGKDVALRAPFLIGEALGAKVPRFDNDHAVGMRVDGESSLISVDIQLISFLRTPVYRVIAGKHLKDGLGLARAS
jgi:hypothetical protein